MAFELMELSTGNLVGVYSTQEAALRDVLDAIERDGVEAIATLALAADDPTGQTDGRFIADGAELAAMVLHPRSSAA
jgi:hypothetical protein